MKTTQNTSESTLVRLAKAGDRNAFAELVKARQSRIRNFLRRLCGDVEQSDDLAQTVFLTMWKSLPELKKPDAFGGWLQQIAINVWKQHIRRNDPLRLADDDEDFVVKGPLISHGLKIDLDRGLQHIAPGARICIVLAYHVGITHEAIAEQTEIPLGTVKSHIKRGSAVLREFLSDYRNQEPDSSLQDVSQTTDSLLSLACKPNEI